MKSDKSMFILYQYIDANYTTNYLARSITYVTYVSIYYPTFSDRTHLSAHKRRMRKKSHR